MKYFVLVATLLAVAVAMPFDIFEDEEGEQYYAVPVSREKRQTKWGATNTGFGVSHQGTILNSNNHQLDGSAYASKNWGSHGIKPDQFGGQLDYSHKPSGSSAFVGADRIPGYGTDVSAGLKQNLYQNKNFGVDVTGQYGRHFGGPGGTGKPQSGVFLNAHGTFKVERYKP
ncbi:hypothetical protein NQ317_004397 [Molorchus minor]|uniref:Attacin C-terminal domain-containing protein n=1 Tax=Molorchus minor TaxID=1323400 RepID=A0ABQ9ISF3_9CUCU|nr:hypothetical protein NQ317_004397 [Molorchus minor]